MSPARQDGRPHEPVPELVERARAGDTDAFELLYKEYSPRVFALCLRLTGGDRSEATGLLQDAFISAWRSLPGFRGDAPFTTWMHRLTINAMLQNVRSARRREARVLSIDDTTRTTAEHHGTDPGVVMDLESAIARLPVGARTAFVLHHIEGYQHQEIAKQLGIAVGTVKAQVHRARCLLIKALER